MSPQEHRRLREELGALALGHLAEAEAAALRAHVDGCAECRAELAELAPVADLLGRVDPARVAAPPHPPADLGARIRAAVAAERAAGEPPATTRGHAAPAATPAATTAATPAATPAVTPAATSAVGDDPDDADRVARPVVRRLGGSAHPAAARGGWARRPALVAAAAALVALGGGVVVGRATAPEPEVPREVVALQEVRDTPVEVAEAVLVPHTWGVEMRMVAAGFAEGRTFRAAFRDARTGRLRPAGAFLGTGAATMVCNLQAAVLREDVSEVVVTDAGGEVVLTAAL
ncbi:zf-HC2 domain-containing protein [Nocardioides perillae]|uniref:Putative zinc-finger domain-containing protein n=1 Tax=Nocardioides perillae TaxID=1119534 RepID=A0A7Y9URV8_9ACTN|nr:zf-HC2 domain-containing protein [Nocardioides perillae]NYG54884.1 hypothetical protein [Nocardioides perillae]